MEILASTDLSTLWFYTTEEAHRYGTKCELWIDGSSVLSLYD